MTRLRQDVARESKKTSRANPTRPVPNASTLGFGAVFLTLIPLFFALGVPLSVNMPLSLLTALLGQQFVRIALQKEDLFGPISIIASYFLLSIVARTIYVFVVEPGAKRLGMVSYDDYFPEALWCSVLAYSALVIGFHAKWAAGLLARLPRRKLSWPKSAPFFRIAVFASLGFAATVYLLRSGDAVVGLGAVSAQKTPNGFPILAASAIPLGWIASYIYFLVRAGHPNKAKAVPLVLMSLVYIAASIGVSGGKQAFFQPLVEGLIVFHYIRKRLRVWQLAVLSVPAILLAFGAINFYRFVIVGANSPKSFSDVVSLGGEAMDAFGSGSRGGRASVFDQMMIRQAGVDALAVIMKYTPNPRPFGLGEPYFKAVVSAVVPRQLWRDKPIFDPGRDFEQQYLCMPSYYQGKTSIQVIADLYSNFWLIGVAVAMLLLGLFLKWFYEFCAPGPQQPGGVYLYAALMPLIGHYMEASVGGDIIQFTRIAAFTVIGALFFGARFAKRPREAWRFVPAFSAEPVSVALMRPPNQPA